MHVTTNGTCTLSTTLALQQPTLHTCSTWRPLLPISWPKDTKQHWCMLRPTTAQQHQVHPAVLCGETVPAAINSEKKCIVGSCAARDLSHIFRQTASACCYECRFVHVATNVASYMLQGHVAFAMSLAIYRQMSYIAHGVLLTMYNLQCFTCDVVPTVYV